MRCRTSIAYGTILLYVKSSMVSESSGYPGYDILINFVLGISGSDDGKSPFLIVETV